MNGLKSLGNANNFLPFFFPNRAQSHVLKILLSHSVVRPQNIDVVIGASLRPIAFDAGVPLGVCVRF